jgi:hypothetical protein
MKEDITRYKGTNPLIGIPAIIGVVAYIILVLTLIPAFWPEDTSGWERFFLGLYFVMMFGFALGFITWIVETVTDEPCIIYASKKVVRAIVAIACLSGIAILLVMLTSLAKPSFSSTVSAACHALALFGVILLLAQSVIAISSDAPAKAKVDRTHQSKSLIYSPLVGAISCLCLGLYQHKREIFSLDRGEALFFVFTVSAISLLWFEDKKTGIADREIIPLCTASMLWIVSALVANYAYASLASVTFVLPYLVYFLPLILLGFYFYVTAPEES